MDKKIDLSVIIPCYNEDERISNTVFQLIKKLEELNVRYEIILVNDGSKDKTDDVIRKFCSNNHIQTISYEINRGKGYAVRRGIEQSQGDYYLIMDADLATDLEALPTFRSERLHADCLIGNRKNKQNKRAFFRNLGGANILVGLSLGLKLKDTQCGFKLLSKETKKNWDAIHSERWGYDFELLYLLEKNKYSIKEIPIKWTEISGSKVNFLSYGNTLFELSKIIYHHKIKSHKKLKQQINP